MAIFLVPALITPQMTIGEVKDVSGPFRLKLLYYLVVKPRTPTELATLENKHLSDVSRGLSRLRADGLVEYDSAGRRERHYKATEEGYIFLYASLRHGR
jgi:predicted transcriptional regulator